MERFSGLLTEKALKRGSHTSIAQLRAAILADVDHNDRGTSRETDPLWVFMPEVGGKGLGPGCSHCAS